MKKVIASATALVFLFTGIHCSNKPSKSERMAAIRTMGDSITLVAQKKLISRLNATIETSGLTGAVQYCSTNALHLLDSIKAAGNITLRRISERYRNKADQPDSADVPVLKSYAQNLSQTDTVVSSRKFFTYYKPIYVTMNTCLKCHGAPVTMDTAVVRLLHELYPNDKATGYVLNDFRGVWKLQFPKTAY